MRYFMSSTKPLLLQLPEFKRQEEVIVIVYIRRYLSTVVLREQILG